MRPWELDSLRVIVGHTGKVILIASLGGGSLPLCTKPSLHHKLLEPHFPSPEAPLNSIRPLVPSLQYLSWDGWCSCENQRPTWWDELAKMNALASNCTRLCLCVVPLIPSFATEMAPPILFLTCLGVLLYERRYHTKFVWWKTCKIFQRRIIYYWNHDHNKGLTI
jgi:hypothetical protein